jgi:hypothetical protein
MALLTLLTQKGLKRGILVCTHDNSRFKTTLFGQVWIRFSEGRFDPQKVPAESPFEAILTLKWAGGAVLGAKTGHFGSFGSFWALVAGGDPSREQNRPEWGHFGPFETIWPKGPKRAKRAILRSYGTDMAKYPYSSTFWTCDIYPIPSTTSWRLHIHPYLHLRLERHHRWLYSVDCTVLTTITCATREADDY